MLRKGRGIGASRSTSENATALPAGVGLPPARMTESASGASSGCTFPPSTRPTKNLPLRRQVTIRMLGSAPWAPAQEIRFEAVDAEVDDEHDRARQDEAGHDAGRVEDALRLRHEIAHAARRAHVLADDGADEGEADRGVEAREDPRHSRRQVDVAEEMAVVRLQHARVVEDDRVDL